MSGMLSELEAYNSLWEEAHNDFGCCHQIAACNNGILVFATQFKKVANFQFHPTEESQLNFLFFSFHKTF
jgi:hypothetical protein